MSIFLSSRTTDEPLHYWLVKPRPILVAPSILASDFSRLGLEAAACEAAGADWIHCDVMDGHFVDNISFGPALVQAVGRNTSLPLDVHLMIERPDHYLPRFLPFSASITSHVEAKHNIPETLATVRRAGLKAGLAVSPSTPIEMVRPYLGQFDILLVMTVVPGFGGQPFLPEMLEKVRRAATWRESDDVEFAIEVDGGINVTTARASIDAGATLLVAGTSVFKAADRAAEIASLRIAAE